MLHRLSVIPIFAMLSLAISPAATVAQTSTPTKASSQAPGVPATQNPSADVAPAQAAIAVPGGTPVSVSLSEAISSATANEGDLVAIVVSKEVDVNGYVVIPNGARGQGTVTHVERAGGNGHGGKLAINLDWIYSADGGKIALSSVNHSSEDGDKKGAASTATIATYLLLGPVGLFAHNFVRGKDVTLGTDKVYNIFVDHDIHVASTQKANAADGFDH